MDHLKSLCWICYSIASVLCFLFCFWLWALWDLAPWAGVEPKLPALEGELLTTGLPGKPLSYPLLGGPSVCKSRSVNPQLFGRNCCVCVNRSRCGVSVRDAILVPFSLRKRDFREEIIPLLLLSYPSPWPSVTPLNNLHDVLGKQRYKRVWQLCVTSLLSLCISLRPLGDTGYV